MYKHSGLYYLFEYMVVINICQLIYRMRLSDIFMDTTNLLNVIKVEFLDNSVSL